MDQRNALLQTVWAAPDDIAARRVFADWLEEHNDPFAAYVRTECDIEASPAGSAEWVAAVERMMAMVRDANSPLGGWRYEPAVSRIRAKLDVLRPRLTSWYKAKPDTLFVPEVGLLQFELRHGISLPGEYRAFLLQIGNEKIGPGTGLARLKLDEDVPSLRIPFPNSPEIIQQLFQDFLDPPRDRDQFPSVDDEDDEDAHPIKFTSDGCLSVVNIGTSNETLLLGVNGPCRGQLWTMGDWYNPLPDKQGKMHNFLSWYEEWLDDEAEEYFFRR